MPQIVNTFLKSKMNKDLDDRLIPNGEYRDASNLQISRSQGSSVGEFENILGNVEKGYLNTGSVKNTMTGVISSYKGVVIGQYTDESTGNIYIYSTNYTGSLQTPRDITVKSDPLNPTIGETWTLHDLTFGSQLNPQVIGIQVGMGVWSDQVNGDPVVTEVNPTNIKISWNPGGVGTIPAGSTLTFGWINTIHYYNAVTETPPVLLVRGGFLNFSTQSKIYGINLLEGLLFWTDNRNQPRRINVDSAIAEPVTYYNNEDQISVAKYYPYDAPLVLEQNILTAASGAAPGVGLFGYNLTMTSVLNIKIGDIVSGLENQNDQDLWEVIAINGLVVTIYNNFLASPTAPVNRPLTFSRPTMTNESEIKNENGFETTVNAVSASPLVPGDILTIDYPFNNLLYTEPDKTPTPQIGDYITSSTMLNASGVAGVTLADEVCIQAITEIIPGNRAKISLTKQVTGVVGNDITIAANPDYNAGFTGDADLIEQEFVRFSYRFKFVDNEYSLSAPFTQICFIPKQKGLFGGGPNDSKQDMEEAYASTIVAWFENRINNIGLKIPIPGKISDYATSADALTALQESYNVKELEILYKESDDSSIKILESLSIAEDILPTSVTRSTPQDKYYYTFNYKSIKPYKTLPTNQLTRVYDKTPIKALAQEVTANRVTYGNFLENHTPPRGIDYEVLFSNKSVSYDNYAQYPNHTVKQNRNYQVGFVLGDRYGRQSTVILSSNDNDENTAGSTIYIPYKTWNEVQSAGGLTTYEWLGNVMRVRVNNGITQTTLNSATGEPGLYKSYSDTDVDSFTISNPGTGYTVGDTCTTNYGLLTNLGLGFGFAFTVQAISGAGPTGPIAGITITNRGSGYADGQVLSVVNGGTSPGTGSGAEITIGVNPPNVLGWQSYKLVVRQQEQEYYNVYLPGFVSGYPVNNGKDTGRIAIAALFGDNINKIPRDLTEVGPLQTEFLASVQLFGRVNNPNINNRQTSGLYFDQRTLPWNTQYFPGRNADEAVTVGPIGQGGLELANSPFEPGTASGGNATQGDFNNGGSVLAPGNSRVPWGIPGADQSFYNVEQNPLATGIRVGAQESQPQLGSTQLNTLGAIVTSVTINPASIQIMCMNPFLSVTETEPVKSQLELFYESSTSGNFVDLNRSVVADYAGVSGLSDSTGTFDESDVIGTAIINSLNFQDSAGNDLTLDGIPVITEVNVEFSDGTTADVQSSNLFIIENDPAGIANKDFRIKTNSNFWYGKFSPSKVNSWSLSFQTSDGGGTYIDTLTNAFTVNLNNIAPDNLQFVSTLNATVYVSGDTVTPTFANTATSIGTFSGKNGSIDAGGIPPNNTLELCWTGITLTAEPVGNAAVFSITTDGVVTISAGSLINGTYTMQATIEDASPGCSPDASSLSSTIDISITVGTPPTDKAICFQEFSAFWLANATTCLGTTVGEAIEVFFGTSQAINNGASGATGSDTQSFLDTLSAPAGPPGANSYNNTSGGGLNLAYYNVRAVALANATCVPPPAPTFTTGGLTQGVLGVKIVLTSSATTSPNFEYNTNYTILHRPLGGSWTQASYIFTDVPGAPATGIVDAFAGGTAGSTYSLEVANAAGATATHTYHFDTVGEYAVRTNGVRGPGCNSAPGGTPSAANAIVEFFDVSTTTLDPCNDCTGPD